MLGLEVVVIGLAVAALVAVGIALKKHGSLTAAEASLKKEVGYLESYASKAEASVKAELTALAARLKAIF